MKQIHARASHGRQLLTGEVVGGLFVIRAAEGPGELTAGQSVPMEGLHLLAPVTPSKVVAVALNYRAHAKEMNKPPPEEPILFIKPTTALIGPGDAIVIPLDSQEVHHECELGIVLGRRLTRATEEEAKAAVFGITCVNDVTARDIQRRQNHYTRSKGYDTFCPVGPFVVSGVDFSNLRLRTRVNGEVRQDGLTSDMIFGPWKLLSFISHVMTLLPGDVVSTGTPPGVGPIRAGDTVEVEIEEVGLLRNPVVASS